MDISLRSFSKFIDLFLHYEFQYFKYLKRPILGVMYVHVQTHFKSVILFIQQIIISKLLLSMSNLTTTTKFAELRNYFIG